MATSRLPLVFCLLSIASGIHISVSQSDGAGTATQTVVLEVDHDMRQPSMHIHEHLQPLMRHMQEMARHMDDLFGDNPLDLGSFFSDPFKHMRAIERALLGKRASPEHPDANALIEHLDSSDPKAMVAAACHCLLHKCTSTLQDQRFSDSDALWRASYACMMKHQRDASLKCQAVLSHTRPALTPGKKAGPIKPDSNGCWHKPNGLWCPKPGGGWYNKQEELMKPEKIAKPKKVVKSEPQDLKGESTPGYLLGEVEAPKGTKDMGGWISRVYTPEQQQRLNVDEFGEPLKQQLHKSSASSKPSSTVDATKPKHSRPEQDATLEPPEQKVSVQHNSESSMQQGAQKDSKSLVKRLKAAVEHLTKKVDLRSCHGLAIIGGLLACLFCCVRICCSKKPKTSVDATYEILLQSDASQTSVDQL